MVTDKSIVYSASWYPHHIAPDLDEIKAAGCNSITLTVSETDWKIFARSRKMAIEMAHERDLKTYIDIHGFGIFPSAQRGSEYLVRHPDKRQIYSNGRVGFFACPNDPEYLAWLKLTTFEMIEYLEADGTIWDEPSLQSLGDYPEVWACRCKHCRARFYDEYHAEMPTRLSDNVLKFRQDSLIRFMSEMFKNSKAAGSQLDALCLMPVDRSLSRGTFERAKHGVIDWEPFAQIPGLDVFGTNPYWIHNNTWEIFLDNSTEVIRLAKKYGLKSQIWVQLAWVPEGREPDIVKSVEKAAELGADMIAGWSYKGEPGSEKFMAENPDLAWQSLSAAFRQL